MPANPQPRFPPLAVKVRGAVDSADGRPRQWEQRRRIGALHPGPPAGALHGIPRLRRAGRHRRRLAQRGARRADRQRGWRADAGRPRLRFRRRAGRHHDQRPCRRAGARRRRHPHRHRPLARQGRLVRPRHRRRAHCRPRAHQVDRARLAAAGDAVHRRGGRRVGRGRSRLSRQRRPGPGPQCRRHRLADQPGQDARHGLGGAPVEEIRDDPPHRPRRRAATAAARCSTPAAESSA